MDSTVDVSEHWKFYLPGFTLPLDFIPFDGRQLFDYSKPSPQVVRNPQGARKRLFPSVLNTEDIQKGHAALPFTTRRELAMLHLMNEITDKPQWELKVFDDEIVARWRTEVSQNTTLDISDQMLDYAIAEVRHKAQIFSETDAVTVYHGDVVKSDTAVPKSIQLALERAICRLEAILEKDFHPGSDDKVVDLVHPSMFPLVYGRSRILMDELMSLEECLSKSGQGEVLPIPPSSGVLNRETSLLGGRIHKPYSQKFQWLPCNVKLLDGSGCKITSYINNLHPQMFEWLYSTIEGLIDCAIPLWNMTLGPLDRKHRYQAIDLRIEYTKALYNPIPEDLRPEREPNEDEEDYWDRVSKWEKSMRVVQQPEPKTFSPRDIRRLDLRKDYKDKGLQIIVKIASIELTPEKPTYEGGSWHVEGQMNEHICATALYYFSSYNITDSRLAFRQESRYEEGDIEYEQDHIEWLADIFGCEQNGPLLQEVGDVLCKEGRLLTFPNILQHRVTPFQLADPTKPGHRKIIALFLVDPNIRIISTENIPPQREDWWHKMDSSRTSELHNNVFSIGEAKEWRAELMEERKAFVDEHNSALAKETFSLCEH